MQMSEKEIVRSYTNAKDKRSQVGVLAELNACPNDTIREILERNGISAPKPGRKSQKKEEPKKLKAQLTEKAKRLIKNDESTESSDLSAPEKVGTHQQEVGTKSEKVITLGDLIGLIDRERNKDEMIAIMDGKSGEYLLAGPSRSSFWDDMENYIVQKIAGPSFGTSGKGIRVWLGEKKRAE